MKHHVRIIARDHGGKAKRWAASDSFAVDASLRKMTPEGFMVVPGNIARTGIQEYSAVELGIEGTNKTIRLLRPPKEVFDEAAVASFERQTLTSGHPDGNVTANNYRGVSVGDVHDVAKCDDGVHLGANLTFKAADSIDLVIAGKDQLSCGYEFDLDMTPGTFEGQAYDGVMTAIVGNHVAHVWNARGGPGLRVADEDRNRKGNDKEIPMKIITIDGIDIEVADATQASLIQRVVKSANDSKDLAVKAKDDAEAKAKAAETALKGVTDAATAAKSASDAKIAELTAQVVSDEAIAKLVEERTKVVSDAKAIVGEKFTDAGKTVAAIRVEALEHIVAAKDGDAATAAAVKAILSGVEPSKAKPEIAKLAFDGAVGVLASSGTRKQTGATDAQAAAFAPAANVNGRLAADAKEWTGEQIFAYRQTHQGKNPPGFDAAKA